jgi:hypothetical protein
MNEHAVLVLLGVGGVATTFSGFSGVVAVFGNRAEGNWSPEEQVRAINMLVLSLVVCLFSFLPLTEELLKISDSAIWVSSSLLFGVFCAIHFVYSIRVTRKLMRIRKGLIVGWVRIAFIVCLLSACLLQALNTAGMGIERGPGPYVAGLLLTLSLAGIQFAYLVLVPLRVGNKNHSSS